jgi:hypothetical protein
LPGQIYLERFIMLPIVALVAGIYLGLNFNILILLPLSVLGAGAFFCSHWAADQGIFYSVGSLLLSIFSAQVGYMIGAMARERYGRLIESLNVGQSKRSEGLRRRST